MDNLNDKKLRQTELRKLRKKAIKIQNQSATKVPMVEAMKRAGKNPEDV
jgi:hypothetical protein